MTPNVAKNAIGIPNATHIAVFQARKINKTIKTIINPEIPFLTNRDIRFLEDNDVRVGDIMTKENLAMVKELFYHC